ncbi:MAG: hypothetical protein JKY66_09715 [Spongiibacteraceae bacterium]|nr:hypothetical protein [Spongiibacteraceae bacterium]
MTTAEPALTTVEEFYDRFSAKNLKFESLDHAYTNTVSLTHLIQVLREHNSTKTTCREKVIAAFAFYSSLGSENLNREKINSYIQQVVDKGIRFDRQRALELATQLQHQFYEDSTLA